MLVLVYNLVSLFTKCTRIIRKLRSCNLCCLSWQECFSMYHNSVWSLSCFVFLFVLFVRFCCSDSSCCPLMFMQLLGEMIHGMGVAQK